MTRRTHSHVLAARNVVGPEAVEAFFILNGDTHAGLELAKRSIELGRVLINPPGRLYPPNRTSPANYTMSAQGHEQTSPSFDLNGSRFSHESNRA
jgi:hypothetical protein